MLIQNTQSHGGRAIEFLQTLRAASESLRNALLKRDPDAISLAVAEEERIARDFHSLRGGNDPAASALPEDTRRETIALVNSIKQDLRASRMLAMSFLGVVDRTIMGLTAKAGDGVVTYNSNGALGARASGLLIQQTG